MYYLPSDVRTYNVSMTVVSDTNITFSVPYSEITITAGFNNTRVLPVATDANGGTIYYYLRETPWLKFTNPDSLYTTYEFYDIDSNSHGLQTAVFKA